MTAKQGHILPFFIPHLGCPCRCVFCDQQQISGKKEAPSVYEINDAINKLDTPAELAFYGGSFTALPSIMQEKYLSSVQYALAKGKITGIRVSTRPDAIDEQRLELLKRYGVKTVELGVQSMQNYVLEKSQRGHTAADSVAALKMLQEAGFKAGVQLMPGLPGADLASDIRGASDILSLRPDFLRIYPTVVIANTKLAEMFQNEEYKPLDITEAVNVAAKIAAIAEYYQVKIIRIGLNPAEELEKQVLAGAYHPAFGNMVKAYLLKDQMLMLLNRERENIAHFHKFVVHKSVLPQAFGQGGENKEILQTYLGEKKLKISGKGENPQTVELVRNDGYKTPLSREEFIELYVEMLQKNLTKSC